MISILGCQLINSDQDEYRLLECHLLENKQKSDSVTRTWVIVMKPDVRRTGGHG
jgi:hypothetical protein